MYFVEEGSGTLLYGDDKAAIKAKDSCISRSA